MSEFINPTQEDIVHLLRQVKRIAVVGLSPKSSRPSYQVAAAMQGYGYAIIPVRPAVDQILGETAYPGLQAVPGKIDLVDVFRAPEYVDPIVDACIAMQIPALWLQDGVINESAAARARAHGLFVVMNRCIYRDYRQFIGE